MEKSFETPGLKEKEDGRTGGTFSPCDLSSDEYSSRILSQYKASLPVPSPWHCVDEWTHTHTAHGNMYADPIEAVLVPWARS